MAHVITSAEYAQILQRAQSREDHNLFSGQHYLIVDLEQIKVSSMPLPMLPVIGINGKEDHPCIDVFAQNPDQLDLLTQAIDLCPTAATTLVQLLRHNERANVIDGLFAESLAYSTLQQSAVFKKWLATRRAPKPSQADESPVLVSREKATLEIILNRPQVHNAYSTAMRDGLCEALMLADVDSSIKEIRICGNGPSYCAGGDLSEFGSVTDAGVAHVSRTTRSAGALLAGLNCRTEVHVHGACIGAGIEVPCFADLIEATEDTLFSLPEVSFGLVPGAGGTVSLTKRIGRHRTAWMALTNQRISADQALDWGLIDRIKQAD
ncbi:MAG: enoyl-CoA hydratase/isomerase family protein [Pseudomonadota bacterium]